LPPTISPPETSSEAGLLEHPAEVFSYFKGEGASRVVCEEKHMGSRAIIIVCRDEEAARKAFGVRDEGCGLVYTRTGRRFFDSPALEQEFIGRLGQALEAANFWEEFKTEWICLDCELMPWSAKARELLRRQYAAVGSATRASFPEAIASLQLAADRGAEAAALLERYAQRMEMARDYVTAYRRYCWSVDSISDLKLAPFHLLATEGATYFDRDHVWHMETLARLCRADSALLQATQSQVVDPADEPSRRQGVEWWAALTARGGEGMVVKPLDYIVKGRRGLVQPAVKCRGREYLRIIYGPEYTAPEHLERLRQRKLNHKRSLATREFALGVESLERFARREPLRRVHECVFGVLALESEPVDPRL
ncbi:MAG TPA: polynucleotide kinase-phosphatase, partial [Blastocatellia bacterium]|nr:polynucleotide kinase-phosphatase [Blastocatellia bacterium]